MFFLNFRLKYYGIFLNVKVVVASLQKVKCSMSLPHVTVNTHCDQTMGRCCCVGHYVMSQWVGDVAIDTQQLCDQQLGSFTQHPGKSGSFTQDAGGRKTWIFHLKT